ncbi:MAG: sulfite exporter TauE/SafE family protein [Actinomycetes bacterium]
MDIALALASGAFIGAVLGFVGAGGAMLSVPILLYIFHFSPSHATTAALAIVFVAALAGTIPKFRSKDILFRDAFSVWGIGLVTNVGASVLSKHLSGDVIVTGFTGVLFVAALSMLRGPVKPDPERRIPVGVLIAISLIIGAITGLFGIGGGFLAIPILVLFYNTPQNKAAGTSLLIIALNCFTAFIAHHSIWHEIRWSIPVAMAIAAVVVTIFASHFSVKVPTSILRKSFAALLILIALYSLAKTWFL